MPSKILVLFFALGSGFTFSQLKINEVLFKQNGIKFDFEYDCSSVVEFINTSTSTISTSGYFLSDDTEAPLKWAFPNVSVAPNARILVFLSGKNINSPELHTNFKMGNHENLYLSNNSTIIDQVSTDNQHLNYSYSRFPDAIGPFAFTQPTLGTANVQGNALFPVSPSVNLVPGVYPVNTPLIFNSNTLPIRYTLNGKEVTLNSAIAPGTITLTDPNLRPNYFSQIPTNPQSTIIGDYTQSRADNRGWVAPYGNVPKAFILRTRTFNTNGIASDEKAYTYFTQTPSFHLPIISIITDSIGYFDEETGIYVYGDDPNGNYNNLGRQYERRTIVQFFDTLGQFEKEIVVGSRIHGNGSRHSAHKALRLYNRFDYDTTQLVLPNGEEVAVALLRAEGQTPFCVGRDFISTKIVDQVELDHADPYHFIVYINGEYWGLQDMRSRLDAEYFGNRYGINEDSVGISDFTYGLIDGNLHVPDELNEITLFAENNDMSIQSNYDYLASRVDMDYLMNLFCAEIYLGNADFPRTNIGFWKYQDAKGETKWKHYIFDIDAAFGGSCDTVYKSFNGLNYFLQETTPDFLKANRMLRKLLLNDNFKVAFMNRMADLLNSEFKPSYVQPIFEAYKKEVNYARLDHVKRWRYPSMSSTLSARATEIPTLDKWNELYNGFTEYFNDRPSKVLKHFNTQFGTSDSIRITLNVNNVSQGLIQISDLYISPALSGVNDLNPFPWTGQYFAGIPFKVVAVSKRGYKFSNWINAPSFTYEASINSASDLQITANFVQDNSFIEPMINEVMIKNESNYVDEFGQYEDWIEIFNKNNYPITMENYFLTDDLTQLTKFRLKSKKESVIPANGYQLFIASDERKRGANHTNFKLSSGETLYLVAPDSTTILDQILLPNVGVDFSYGSSPNGSATRVMFQHPTPLYNNDLAGELELEKLKKSFVVFPNPSNGAIVNTSLINDYNVFSMQGALVLEVKNTNQLPVMALQQGTYMVVNKEGVTQLLVITK